VHCSGIVIAVLDGCADDCADQSLKHRLYHIRDKQVRLELLGLRPRVTMYERPKNTAYTDYSLQLELSKH